MLCTVLCNGIWARSQPRLYTQETKHFRIVYYSPEHEYLAPLLIRSLESAQQFYRKQFGYEPNGKITILIQDFDDSGYGGAGTVPTNFIQIGIEPFDLVFETLPSAERMGLMSHHELMHIVMGDQTAPRDAMFRKIFFGKIMPNTDDPISIPFSFLGNPRVYSPRWFHEGGAVFMETWLGGGFGRALGGYDEMMFRAMVRRHKVPAIVVNQVGGNDQIVFDGASFAMDAEGNVIASAASFAEDLVIADTTTGEGDRHANLPDECEAVYQALVLGIVMRTADAASFEKVHAIAQHASDEAELERYYSALAKVRDPQLAAQVAQIALSPELPPQAVQLRLGLLLGLASEHHELAWTAFSNNADTLLSPYPSMAPLIMAQYIPTAFWDAVPLDQLEAWVRSRVPAEMSANVDRGMESARFMLSEKQTLVPAADAYVHSSAVTATNPGDH